MLLHCWNCWEPRRSGVARIDFALNLDGCCSILLAVFGTCHGLTSWCNPLPGVQNPWCHCGHGSSKPINWRLEKTWFNDGNVNSVQINRWNLYCWNHCILKFGHIWFLFAIGLKCLKYHWKILISFSISRGLRVASVDSELTRLGRFATFDGPERVSMPRPKRRLRKGP